MNPSVFSIFSLFSILALFTGCLNGSGDGGSSSATSVTTTTLSSTTKDLGFSGVSSVTSLGPTSLKIQWSAATSPDVQWYRIYELSPDGTLTSLGNVSSSILSYVHSSLSLGSYHSYVVRAFDSTFNDGNSNFKSSYTYSGVSSVSITGTATATVYFSAASFADTFNIYATANGTTTLLGSAASTATSFAATGLNSGTNYSFSAKAVVAGVEYDTAVFQSGKTTTQSQTKYRGVMLVQAYGDAPGAPTGTPQTKRTIITWNGFAGSSTTTKYSLVRTGMGQPLNSTTTTECTSSLTSSCRVCAITGSGAQTCVDTNVAASPQAYDYAVVLVPSSTGVAEDLPTNDSAYRITVQIPPANMVLVHRDAANYEMCQTLGLNSDPLNHQRCIYTGVGAVPYSTGPGAAPLNLAAGYYDFGYNLFVDRWAASCNWTQSQASGGSGMCGAGNTAGDCYGTATPDNTIGVVGNVYYETDAGSCYYRQSGSWYSANSTSLTSVERSLMYTINPIGNGGYKPPLVYIDQTRSMLTCQSVVDTDYGAKRLMRRREYSSMAAWRYFPGEPNMAGVADPLTDAQITNYEGTNSATTHTTLNYCNAYTHSGITPTTFTGTEIARGSEAGSESFVAGSVGTKNCVSRFGVQDHVGNVMQWTSDQLSCSNLTHNCSGVQSSLDSSNGYSAGFDFNNFLFDGIQGPGGTSAGQVAANYTSEWSIGSGVVGGTGQGQGFGAGYFNFPLGVPMVGNDGSNAKSIALYAKFYADYFWLYPDTAGVNNRGLRVGGSWSSGNSGVGRWVFNGTSQPSAISIGTGFRCVLPAE